MKTRAKQMFYLLFFQQLYWDFYYIYYRKMGKSQMRQSLMMFVMIVCFLQGSSQAEQNFQALTVPFPFPYNLNYFISAQTAVSRVRVNGATTYYHIAINQDPTGLSKDNATLYRPDDYTFPSPVAGTVRQYIYIKNAPGLVKVQIAIFKSGIVTVSRFFIAGQFDKGYTFIQFYTSSSCQIKVSVGVNVASKYSIFQSKADAFSTSLQQLNVGTQVFSLPTAGRYYIRFNHDIASQLVHASLPSAMIVSLGNDTHCQNQCPYGQLFFSAAQIGNDNICACLQPSFGYNPTTKQCTDCSTSSSASQCKQMYSNICGDGIRQDKQQCDSDTAISGCSNCVIDQQYSCKENQFKQSSCQIKSKSQQNLEGLSVQARNRIIIGVCVGVGGAIILGIAIYFIIKNMKGKKSSEIPQTSKYHQEKPVETQKPSESIEIII